MTLHRRLGNDVCPYRSVLSELIGRMLHEDISWRPLYSRGVLRLLGLDD